MEIVLFLLKNAKTIGIAYFTTKIIKDVIICIHPHFSQAKIYGIKKSVELTDFYTVSDCLRKQFTLRKQFARCFSRRMVNEQARFVLDRINNVVGQFYRNGRATLASAQTLVVLDERFRYIIGAVHHDSAVACIVVHASFLSVEPHGFAVFAGIDFAGNVKSEAAFERFGLVRKSIGKLLTRVFAVRDKRVEQNCIG